MGAETSIWYNTMQIIGYAKKRGNAWWYRKELDGINGRPNHYDGPVPVDAALQLIDFDVHGIPVGIQGPDGSFIPLASGRKAMVCSDNRLPGLADDLGVFKASYNEKDHQYKAWFFKVSEQVVGQGLDLGSIGLLRNRGQAYAQFEMPDNVKTKHGVEFRPNLLMATSFDGSLASIAKRTKGIVVCDNTLAGALSEGGFAYKIKHTKFSGFRINNAREALDIVVQDAEASCAELDQLCETPVTARQWQQFLDAFAPLPTDASGKVYTPKSTRGETLAVTKREKLTQLYLTDQRCAPWQNSVFGVLQAVNTYAHHEGLIRGNVHRATRNMEAVISGKMEANDNLALATIQKILAA